jgi:predicted protein tyrosine phosphatase
MLLARQEKTDMSRVHVCSVDRLPDVAASSGARTLVTLLRENHLVDRPQTIAPARYLRLSFNDIIEPREGLALVQGTHVAALIDFVQRWDRQEPLLIHCFAGVSRSTAGAYITACLLQPQVSEAEWAARLRNASPTATPNARVIALADALLKREGRMISAIAAIGRGAECHSGEPFFLDLALP